MNRDVCTIHEIVDSDSDTVVVSSNKRRRKTSRDCEDNNCWDEIFSSCHKCSALLCYNHFIEDTEDCLSHTVNNSLGGEKENLNPNKIFEDVLVDVSLSGSKLPTQRIPEDYVVDGSNKEAEERKRKKNLHKEAKKKEVFWAGLYHTKHDELSTPKTSW